MLPRDFPRARILSYGYSSNWLGPGSMSTSLDAVSSQFLSLLHEKRKECQQRPIIFIAHCFGGIVLEKAILKALLNNSIEDSSLVECIVGIVFLGTPHRGTPKARFANTVAAVAAATSDSVKNSPILQPLKEDSQILYDTVGEFARWANRVKLRIHCFYEQLETDIIRMAGSLLRLGLSSNSILVPRDSACLQGHGETALNLNHIKLNRFTDPTDANYILVSRELRHMWPTLALKRDCLDSLYFKQVQDRELDIKPALEDTTTWLFEREEYKNWTSWDVPHSATRPGMVWIKGKPGSGKSTLMKEALKRARALAKTSSFSVAAYFFTARSNEVLQKSRLGLFRAILRNLIQQDTVLLSAFACRYQAKCGEVLDKAWDWELDELQDFFKSAYSGIPDVRRTMLFIDALDESEGEGDMDAYSVARELVYFFYDITFGSQLKVCFSSRHYPQVHVPHCPQIVTEQSNSDDIFQLITVKLLGARHDQRARVLAGKLSAKADGVFLWVVLVIQKLNMGLGNEMTDQDLDELLKTVPSELEKLFVDLFANSTSKSELQTAVKIFQWILLVKTPLEPHELRHALTIDKSKMTSLENSSDWHLSQNCLPEDPDKFLTALRGYTRGLAETSRNRRGSVRIQFIHETARELFLSGPGFSLLENMSLSSTSTPAPSKSLAERHEALAEYCIASICQVAGCDSSEESLHYILRRHPILLYATHFEKLYYHVQQVEKLGSGKVIPTSLVTALLQPDRAFWNSWKSFAEASTGATMKPLAFHYLCYKGLLVSAQALLDRGVDVNIGDRTQWTALHDAVCCRNKAALRFLLNNGADPCAADLYGRTALHLAFPYGTRLADLVSGLEPLLTNHRCLTIADSGGDTPLHAALKRSNFAFAKFLLSLGARVDSLTADGHTPLHSLMQRTRSSNGGHLGYLPSDEITTGVDLLKAMIAAGADRNASDRLGKTPLHYALETPANFWAVSTLVLGDSESLDILDVTKPDNEGQTPLHYAVRGGSQDDSSDDDEAEGGNIADECNWPVTGWSQERGSTSDRREIIRLLVRAGAIVAAKDSHGRTALHDARAWVTEGEDDLRLLLQRGKAGRAARAELASFAGTWTIGGISIRDPNASNQSGKVNATVQKDLPPERRPLPPSFPSSYGGSTGGGWGSGAED